LFRNSKLQEKRDYGKSFFKFFPYFFVNFAYDNFTLRKTSIVPQTFAGKAKKEIE